MAYRDNNKRVRTIKRAIITIVVVLVIVPTLLCVVLFFKLNKLQDKLDTLISMKESGEIVLTTNDIGERIFVYSESVLPDVEEVVNLQDPNIVYLTFDDGPSKYTDDILDILDTYGVKATFFVVGKEDQNSVEMYRSIVEKGNSLGIHTYSHVFKNIYSSEEDFAVEIEKLKTLLYSCTGIEVDLFRFPGGSSSPLINRYGNNVEEFISYLNENGYVYFDWNVSSGDGAEGKSTEDIINNVLSGVEGKKSSVILMHDDPNKGTTVEALPVIIKTLLENGYEIRPLDDTVTPVQHVLAE